MTDQHTLSQDIPGSPADIKLMGGSLYCFGAWTLEGVENLEQRLTQLRWPLSEEILLDGSHLKALDTIGALFLVNIISRLQADGRHVQMENFRREHQTLLDLVKERNQNAHLPAEAGKRLSPLAWLGKKTWEKVQHGEGILTFLGEASIALGRNLLQPTRFRGHALFVNIQKAGFDAIPIVGLLSFLIGVVIAYQGGDQLRFYGANIFIVELVCLTMVRELAPLIAAIIVAGRTGSAFAAQIGTMKVTEEVDALRIIGIAPFDILVLPKLLGLLVALPLLAVFADISSIFGGMMVAYFLLDISFTEFITRIPQVVSLFSFLFGVFKAPVFAIIIALVGCYQGFQASGGADSVGQQTTASVVQAIFLVIVADAIFAVFLGTVGF